MKTWCAMLGCLLAFAQAAWAIDPWTGPTRQAPHRGMTKAEVVAYYGEPYHRVASGPDEHWYYRLKYNEVYGRAFVPFEVDSENVRLGIITFDAAGKIKCYDWKHSVVR